MPILATLTQRKLEPVQRFEVYPRKFTGVVKLKSTTSFGTGQVVNKNEDGVL